MGLLKWSDSMSVGNAVIDAQNKVLVEAIDEIYSGIARGKCEMLLEDKLPFLADYTRYHFETEEMLLRMAKCEHIDEHIARHDAIRKKIYQYENAIKEHEHINTEELCIFLKDWLTKHIMQKDKSYAQSLEGLSIDEDISNFEYNKMPL